MGELHKQDFKHLKLFINPIATIRHFEGQTAIKAK